jgi:nicotinate-nucleotide--dimethylbenzimidazole phosphoribosyltransferase
MSNNPIPGIDLDAARSTQARLDRKTKPSLSLGRLEELAVSLAGICGKTSLHFPRKVVLVAAADHGIAQQGVSAYPAEVTPQMVLNFLSGGAAINVLARQAGASVKVVDAGVRGEAFAPHPDLFHEYKIAPGTSDITQGPAMTREQAARCFEVGALVVGRLAAQGLDLLATGDMGIGNTSASSAIAVAALKLPARELTGRGTGVDAKVWEHKVAMVEKAVALNQADASDALDLCSKLGGFEIGVLAGAMLEASRRRIPVILDGFISGAAALLAAIHDPACRQYMIASHQSVEIGHRHVLERLGLRAYLNLDLRLGEGSGAALCFHLVEASCRILEEMATFESAGVSDKA